MCEQDEYKGYTFGSREGLTLREKLCYELNLNTPFSMKNPLDLLGESLVDTLQPVPQVPEDVIGTEIQEAFRGVSVLITGGTGFIGKLLMEKLLRSMPHIAHLYILIRKKKGKSVKERLEELLDPRLFRRLSKEKPNFRSKITAIEGDVCEPGLGLSAADRQMLVDNVSMIFHGAATTRFSNHIKSAVQINLIGTLEIIKLAKELKHLKAFVHVSTAFVVSSTLKESEEEFYPMNYKYQDIIKLVETNSDEELDVMTNSILGKFKNTYLFTKALAELAIKEQCQGMPVAVFRPSIVLSTYREPVRGWNEMTFGLSAIYLAISVGFLHILNISENNSPDCVPADFTVNAAIAIAWKTATVRQDNIPIYNYGANAQKTYSVKSIAHVGLKVLRTFPTLKIVDYPWVYYPTNYYMFKITNYVVHHIKGYLMDLILLAKGEKPFFSKTYRKIDNLWDQLFYFSETFRFKNHQTQNLWKSLSPQDKDIFVFDIDLLDLQFYYQASSMGYRNYVGNDPMTTIPQAKKKLDKLYEYNCVAMVVIVVVAFHLLYQLMMFMYNCL